MKTINCFVLCLFLLLVSTSICSQTGIEAGPNQSVVCSNPVQLNATAFRGWGEISTIVPITPSSFSSVHFTSSEIGYAVTSKGEIFKTFDGGVFWGQSFLPFSFPLYDVYFLNSSDGFVVGINGSILRTKDAGTTWIPVISNTTSLLRSIFFVSSNTGYIVGDSGTILKTTDGGLSWSLIKSGIASKLYSVYFNSPETGFISASSGVLLTTTDGGNSWVTKTLVPNNPTLFSIHFPSTNIGYISGSQGVILKTTDGGTNWNKYQADSVFMEADNDTTKARALNGAVLNSIYFTSENTGYAAGSYLSNSIFIKTTDGGMNWYEQKNNLSRNTKITSFCFPNDSTGYAVGNFGRVAKLSSNNFNFSNISWYPSEGLSNPNIANPTANPTTTTTYHVIAPYPQAGRDFTDSVVVTVESLNLTQPKAKYYGCGGSILLDNYKTNYTGVNKLTYKWTPATGLSSDTVAFPLATISNNFPSYNLTITAPGGCSASTTVLVKDSLYVNASVNKTIVCSGTAQLTSISNYSGTGILRYKWTPSIGLNNDTIPNPTVTVSSSTTYTVRITAENGCTASADVMVSVITLTANAGIDKSVKCGNSIQMATVTTNYNGSEMLRYKWTPSIGLNNDTIANPIVLPTIKTIYTVKVSTPSGCIATDDVIIDVIPLTANAGADKWVTCGGLVKLDSATINSSETGRLRYKWIPSTGLNNDTIANPTSSITESTTYYVTVTSAFGCTASDDVVVNVTPLTVNAGADKYITCGEKVQLNVASTNYSGILPLKYKWTPSIGLDNDTIANPQATPKANISYTLTVISPTCTASDIVVVNVIPITVNVGYDKIATCGEKVQLSVASTNYSGIIPLKYKWTPSIGLDNDTIANPLAIMNANVTYTLTVKSPTGCTATDNVAIRMIGMTKPTINYVGINENKKNILFWSKPTTGKVNVFNIYKETNITNSYLKVGSVSVDSASMFIDENSNPNIQSNKYKISILDACGNETVLSDFHKTMHLSINKGINTVWNLIWESYVGFPVSTYNIFRGTSPSNIQIIGSLSGSNTQFSDYSAPDGYVFYQIEAVSSSLSGVKPNYYGVKSMIENAYSSRSNIATNKSDINGVFELKNISDEFALYPNPASTFIRVVFNDYSLSNLKLYIYNSVGQLLKTHDKIINNQQLDVSEFSDGMYTIVAQSDKVVGRRKLLIQK